MIMALKARANGSSIPRLRLCQPVKIEQLASNRGSWEKSDMTKFFKMMTVALPFTALMTVAACGNNTDPAAEARADAYENQADATREAADQQTDAMKAQAGNMADAAGEAGEANEDAMINSAKAIEERADEAADNLDAKADAVREANPK